MQLYDKLLCLGISVVVLGRLVRAEGGTCPEWRDNGSKGKVVSDLATCYHFVREQQSWSGAVEACKNKGWELVRIMNKRENNFIVRAFLPDMYMTCTWIGLSQHGIWTKEYRYPNDKVQPPNEIEDNDSPTTELPKLNVDKSRQPEYEQRTARAIVVIKIDSMDGCHLQTPPDMFTREALASRCIRRCLGELSPCKFVNFLPSTHACLGFSDLSLENSVTECGKEDEWELWKI